MKMNVKGDLGFPEAIMAVMVVTLVLTAYIGLFALDNSRSDTPAPDSDRNLVDGIKIVDGTVSGDIVPELTAFIEKNGYRGMIVRCTVPGGIAEGGVEFTVGEMDGPVTGERFIRSVLSDDGRLIPIVFEVAICA
jgi:hypothetical protein